MTMRRTTLACAATLLAIVATVSFVEARDRSGHGSGMGHTGLPRPTGNTLGGKPLVRKGADIGQARPSPGMNNPDISRRDRRGQPPLQPNVDKGPKPKTRLGEHCLPHARPCRKFDPYQEFPNRRAQVRDHRKP
jgi:hypothetical protein